MPISVVRIFMTQTLIFRSLPVEAWRPRRSGKGRWLQLRLILNDIRTLHSESSGFKVKLTRFKIEGWLELIGTPSVDILN